MSADLVAIAQINGIWLLLLLGRLSMITGWRDLLTNGPQRDKREFVSADARLDDIKKDTRSYEMLSRDSGKTVDDVVTPSVVTPLSPVAAKSAMRSPSAAASPPTEYPFGNEYYGNHAAVRGASPPNGDGRRTPDYFGQTVRYQTPVRSFSSPRPPQSVSWDPQETYARPMRYVSPGRNDDYKNPLGMNRI